MTAPVLSLHGVHRSFGPVPVLLDVSVDLRPGEVHALIGENGAGMEEIIARTQAGDPMIPANVTYPPAMIGTAIEVTVVGLVSSAPVSSAPVSGTFTIGSVLVTPENADQYHFPDSPF